MPGPCSAPTGQRDERGRTPRTGKTDVVKRGAPRKAHLDEMERLRAERARQALSRVHAAS